MSILMRDMTWAGVVLHVAICCLGSLSGCADSQERGPEAFSALQASQPLLGVRLSASTQAGNPVVTVEATNNSREALYVYLGDWSDWDEATRKGPYVFPGGPHTLAFYWGCVLPPSEKVTWGSGGSPTWVPAQRLTPGKTVTFKVTLRPKILDVNRHCAFPVSKDSLYRWPGGEMFLDVTRVVAIVGYWQEQALLAMDDRFETTKSTLRDVRNKVEGRILLTLGVISDPERLPLASYGRALAEALYRQDGDWLPVGIGAVQLFAVSEPLVLDNSIIAVPHPVK
jgi:hypothetical protein